LKLKYDKLLSDFAFKFNLRRYTLSISGAEMGLADDILQFALLFCSLFVVGCRT